MASIINVDQIKNAAGTSGLTLDSSTGKASFPNGATSPAGSVVQVVNTSSDTRTNTTSTSYVVATDIAATITPTSSSSKIYVCLLYTSPSPRDRTRSRMPSSA